MTKLPDVLLPHDLPLAELHAARLLGEVYPLADAFCPVDVPGSAGLRAASVAGIAPPRFVADRLTAAWIWGAVQAPPARAQFSVDIRVRAKLGWSTVFDAREVVIDPHEVVALGAALVTAPVRTALDVARDVSIDDDPAVAVLVGLVACGSGLRIDRAIADLLARPRHSNRRVAEERLLRAASAVVDAVHVVDGVDAPDGVEHPVEVGRVAHLEDEPAERQSVA